jgi:hypothetical protein
MKRFSLPVALFLLSLIAVVVGAAELTSSVHVVAKSAHTVAVGLSTVTDTVGFSVNRSYANGTSSAQCDLVYHASRTLTTAASESLDLAGGITDAFGTAVTFAKVKSIVIENTSASMTLTIGGDGTAPFETWASGTVLVPPLGTFALVAPGAGFTVTATTGDLLKILNSSGSSTTYKIWINGTSS